MSQTRPWISARIARALKNSPNPSLSPPQGGESHKYRVAGIIAGAINGLFGGGGGIPLLLLLTKWAGMDEKRAFATCVAVILPFCGISSAVYLLQGGFSISAALPYLAGGLVGGFLGGKMFRNIPNLWLRRIFALFLLYGAWRYLVT